MNKKQDKQGWDYITETFEKIYPGQKQPLHYGTLDSRQLGGNDPLEGISVYDGRSYWHFVTYGFSELFEKESTNTEYSGYGFELTVKLKKGENIDEAELNCMAGILQSLGRFVYKSDIAFTPYEYIYTGQKNGIDLKGKSKITGFGIIPDSVGEIYTPNGKLRFLQLIGFTDKELKAIDTKKISTQQMIKKLGNSLTDYLRDDII